MTRYTKLTPDNRIDTTVVFPIPKEADFFEFHFPEDFDFERQGDWRIVDGQLVHDPLPEPEPAPDPIAQLRAEYDVAFVELAALITGGVI